MFIPAVTTIFNLDNGWLSTYPYYTVPRWGKTAQGEPSPVHQLWRLCDTWLGLQSHCTLGQHADLEVICVPVPLYHRLSDSATGIALCLAALLSSSAAEGMVVLPCCPECSDSVMWRYWGHIVSHSHVSLSPPTLATSNMSPDQGWVLSSHRGGYWPHPLSPPRWPPAICPIQHSWHMRPALSPDSRL